MNKRLNTVFFILGATLFNILVTVAAFFLLLLVYVNLIRGPLSDGAVSWAIPLIFIAAIIVSFIVYRFSLGILIKKIDMDKYFDPIFHGRRR